MELQREIGGHQVGFGPYTEHDLPEDDKLVELLEGNLLVNALPSVLHQVVVNRLRNLIGPTVAEGYEVLEAGIRLPGGSCFIPDLAVVPVEGFMDMGEATFDPQVIRLVVEVVSPSSQSMDRLVKPVKYAEAGIPEFWLVETGKRLPDTTIHVYKLNHGVYAEERTFSLTA